MIVAIDGPAGSGKSTVARTIARKHGFTYLDTGAMYRCVALEALESGVPLDDQKALEDLAEGASISFGRAADGSQTVVLDGRDVTCMIRTPEVDRAVSAVSSVPAVRSVMVERQREAARGSDVVAEGRDIGTVVFPQAEVKVFLTASPEARAHRRAEQNRERGCAADGTATEESSVLAALVARDEADSSRKVSPLRAADDAVHVDSSSLSVDEVVARVSALIGEVRHG